jgi:hypothetical protein
MCGIVGRSVRRRVRGSIRKGVRCLRGLLRSGLRLRRKLIINEFSRTDFVVESEGIIFLEKSSCHVSLMKVDLNT